MDCERRGTSHRALAPDRTHLVGIADREMAGLAQWLVQRGRAVSGSEPQPGPVVARLRALGVRVHVGHPSRSGPSESRLLVYGPGTRRDHPDRLAAARAGVPQESILARLERLLAARFGLVVAGGRAASAASAMIGWTLTRAGLDPTVLLGASVPQLGGWARVGSGPHFVVEAIEGPGAIGPTSPKLAVLLDLEPCGAGDGDNRARALRRFADSVPADGHVLAFGPEAVLAATLRGLAAPVESLSLDRGAAWWGADLREERGCYRFRVFHCGRFAVELRLQVPGHRQVLSALAAVAACLRLGVSTCLIKESLEEFTGLARDFESRGSYRGVTLVDDEGQSAAAVRETLDCGRRRFGGRRLWAVWNVPGDGVVAGEAADYRAAFAPADRVLVLAAGPSGEGCGAGALVAALAEGGAWVKQASCLDDAISELDRHLEPGDVLVTLGAGDVGTISDAFIRRLPRDRQGR